MKYEKAQLMLGFSLSKNPIFARARIGFFDIYKPEYREYEARQKSSPLPLRKLFKIHGSKLKPHPVRHLGQAAVLCITHGVFFLGIGEDSFNGLFPSSIECPVLRRIPGVVRQLLIVLPNMSLHSFHAVLCMRTELPCGATGTDSGGAPVFPVSIPVGRPVGQGLVFRADHAVVVFIINILPPFVPALHDLRTLISCG